MRGYEPMARQAADLLRQGARHEDRWRHGQNFNRKLFSKHPHRISRTLPIIVHLRGWWQITSRELTKTALLNFLNSTNRIRRRASHRTSPPKSCTTNEYSTTIIQLPGCHCGQHVITMTMDTKCARRACQDNTNYKDTINMTMKTILTAPVRSYRSQGRLRTRSATTARL